MFKWVLGLCLTIYATLMLLGGDGYHPEEIAVTAPEAEPAVEVAEVVPAPAVVEAAPVTVVEDEAIAETLVQAPEAVLEQPTTPFEPAPVIEVTRTDTTSIASSSLVGLTVPIPAAEPEPVPVEVASIAPTAPEVSAPKPPNEIWQVTGSRVNLRAGASTADRIIGRAVRGDSAEIIEMLPSGWAKVYVIEAGLEAYMSAKFVAPTDQ